jgi:uncharacterized protein YdaU (DUF1376 family)
MFHRTRMQDAVPSPYPYFPFYAADFDTDTRDMTHGAVGIYIRLLISQWINGNVPDDQARLHRIAGTDTQEQFDELWSEIQHKFAADKHGTLQNLRLEQERTRTSYITESRRKAGIMSGKARRKRSTKQQDRTHDRTDDEQSTKHSESESESESKKDKREASPPLPDALNREAWDDWLAYRRESRWKKWVPRTVKSRTEMLAQYTHEEQWTIILHSIDNGYKGLFPDSALGGSHGRRERLGPAERIEKATGVKRL